MTSEAPRSRRKRWLVMLLLLATAIAAFVVGAAFGWRDGHVVDEACGWCGSDLPDFFHLGSCILTTSEENFAFYGLDLPESASAIADLPLSLRIREPDLEDFQVTIRYPRAWLAAVGEEADPAGLRVERWIREPAPELRQLTLPGSTRRVETIGGFDYVSYSVPRLTSADLELRIREPFRITERTTREDAASADRLAHRTGSAVCQGLEIQVTIVARDFGPLDYELRLIPILGATTEAELREGALARLGDLCYHERRMLAFGHRFRGPERAFPPCVALVLPAFEPSGESALGADFRSSGEASWHAQVQPEAQTVDIFGQDGPPVSVLEPGAGAGEHYEISCERLR